MVLVPFGHPFSQPPKGGFPKNPHPHHTHTPKCTNATTCTVPLAICVRASLCQAGPQQQAHPNTRRFMAFNQAVFFFHRGFVFSSFSSSQWPKSKRHVRQTSEAGRGGLQSAAGRPGRQRPLGGGAAAGGAPGVRGPAELCGDAGHRDGGALERESGRVKFAECDKELGEAGLWDMDFGGKCLLPLRPPTGVHFFKGTAKRETLKQRQTHKSLRPTNSEVEHKKDMVCRGLWVPC